ncbi:MAG TPA: NAD-glutamate dehydrogenase domain-containing protein [Candidatus Acidoferrales bacterium]|nr:NAD-glutamate dehydrogenase domain-containing protein [Candidatus Acidoferrales bacterium]
MEERERAVAPPPPSADPPKLRDTIEEVRARIAPGERPLAEGLVRQLLDRSGSDLLQTAAVAELAGMALTMFRFLLEPGRNEPRVAITTPSSENGDWNAPPFVLQTLLHDRPFIVDTVEECLQQAGCAARRFLHPIFRVERDTRGTLLSTSSNPDLGHAESMLYIELDRIADPEALTQQISDCLGDVVLATNDYQAMRHKAEELADELRTRALPRPWNADVDELAAFLDWLGNKNFVFLGYREYRFSGQGGERSGAVRAGSGLGLLRKEARSNYVATRPLPDIVRRRLSEAPLHMMSKTNAQSTVHRRTHMDYIGIKDVDAAGVVVGERRFIGLFTQRAYAQEPMTVPVLRMKLASILEAEGASEGSHDYKQIVAAFNSMPRVELLALDAADLQDSIKTIIAATGGTDLRVALHPDSLRRGAFVAVVMPRERFSEDIYHRIEARLIELLAAGAVLERRLAIDESDQVRMHFYVAARGDSLRSLPAAELRSGLLTLMRTWDDRLREALRAERSREQAIALTARYTAAFSASYKASTDTAAALRDIASIEALAATRAPQVEWFNPSAATGSDPRFTVVKLYLVDEELVLSDFLPVLENLGLKVFAQDPVDLDVPGIGVVRIHSFFVQDRNGARIDVDSAGARLRPALLALYRQRVENDRLNGLILSAGLEWRQVDLLRTYVLHGVQIGTAPSREALTHALVAHPRSAGVLWSFFDAKFNPLDPTPPRDRDKLRLAELQTKFVATLDDVESVVEDKMLRGLLGALAASVRTTYYRPGSEASGTIAIKIDCRKLPQLPGTQPILEIYVHGQEVEGLHLRGAKVARGGIRLSDRPDDFRTEILDLMRTQTVKNSVIVPGGAKGGFVVKRRPGTTVTAAQVVSAYRTFIGALLDLTDNIVQGRVESPVGTLLHDDLDPYLVVAADKGTATLSDIANDISQQRNFWLGDAFASGGSNGYDHKKVGITARGAWECVRRHFREMGRDADRDELTVIGIGDMSGDVFGNGLLLSRRFRLRAAFNHQHIFIDPEPDAGVSYNERERLFRLPRSTWADYNAQAISDGGGVYLRSAKAIPLSPAAKRMLGIDDPGPSGDAVVRAILCMEVDLLWNGGIGTYVKATDETNLSVGDSANDAVRIDGAQLRVRVVAEGGNLGLTQRGRIEYALRGGRLHNDAIDNSAGVDMSDHEVNLKIALSAPVESGQLSLNERNALLADLEDEVSHRVLAHNRRQARIISLDQLRSQTRLNEFRDQLIQLESEGALDRRAEALPERETLRNRRGAFLGLARPELAVLLAHSKLALQQALLSSPLPDDPYFERFLRGYFPDAVNARFGIAIRSHRLRREIIAVEAANMLIDTMGTTFTGRISRDEGAPTAAVVRAWNIVSAACDAAPLWQQVVEGDPPLTIQAEARCCLALEAALERATKWVIETQPPDAPSAEMVEGLATPMRELLALLPDVLPPVSRAAYESAVEALAGEGVPRALGQSIARLQRLAELFEIAEIAAGLEVARPLVAQVYYRTGELVDLDWVIAGLRDLPAEDRWERRAVEELHHSLTQARREITNEILAERHQDEPGEVGQYLAAYAEKRADKLSRIGRVVNDLKGARRPTLAALLVVVKELGRLVGLPT